MPPPRLLAVSPHLDDAVFSCGGSLARLAARGWSVRVCTVFTRSVEAPSGFALACQLDKGLPPDVDYMALRRAEDAEACGRLGLATPLWLDLPEAPHRGYGSAAALFGDIVSADEIRDEVGARLGEVVREEKPDCILAPQSVGSHVDHRQVVEAIRGLGLALPLCWWVDFPYSVRDDQPKQPFAALFASLDGWSVALSDREADRKRDAMLAYGTQVGFQFGDEQRRAAILAKAAGERFASPPRCPVRPLLNGGGLPPP